MPMATLPMAYAAKAHQRPASARARDSFEKVENVVKPPHNPTVRDNRTDSLQSKRDAHPPKSPMARLPTAFTANVAHGNTAEPIHIPTR